MRITGCGYVKLRLSMNFRKEHAGKDEEGKAIQHMERHSIITTRQYLLSGDCI